MCREALTRALNPLQRTNAMLALSEPLLTGGSLEDAKNFAQTAANDFRARGQRDSEWRSLLLLARIYERQNDTERSKEFASESLDILNQFGNNWEAADGRSYRNRPDVEAGRRKLLTLVNEKRRSRP